ncbi:MAG: DUF5683 domain-containing protein [Rhodothermales bacterium]
MLNRILALLLTLLLSASANAQPVRSEVLEEIQQAYRDLDYDTADRKAREALDQYGDFTVGQLTDLHTILGLIAYNRSDFLEARRQFISAIQLTPDLELDPLLVPPKILTYFDSVKDELQTGGIETAPAASRYVFVRDPRPDAAVRSMLLPGWGQLYKGHKLKAWALSGAWVATVAGALWSHRMRTIAREDYREAENQDDIEILYDRYNRWHKTRNALAQGAVVVWIVGYVDALLTDAANSASQGPLAGPVYGRGVGPLTVHVAPQSVSLTVTF